MYLPVFGSLWQQVEGVCVNGHVNKVKLLFWKMTVDHTTNANMLTLRRREEF